MRKMLRRKRKIPLPRAMTRWAFLFFLFSLLLPGAAALARSQCVPLYRRDLDDYNRLIRDSSASARELRELADSFSGLALQYPDCHKADDALFLSGVLATRAYQAGGNPEDLELALAAFQRLISSHPDSLLADDGLYYAGEAFWLLGRKDKAERAWRECLKSRDEELRKKASLRLQQFAHAKSRLNQENSPQTPVSPKSRASRQTSAESPAGREEPKSGASDEAEIVALSFGLSPGKAEPIESGNEEQEKSGDEKENAGQENRADSPAAGSSAEARLLGIRYWSNQDYTRVVVDLDREIPYDPPHLLRPDPELGVGPRLYIDFKNTSIPPHLKKMTPEPGCFTMPIGDGLLKKARAGQFTPQTARVVLDLERISRYHAFPLPGEPFRYVIDVYGGQAPAGAAAKVSSGEEAGRKPEKSQSSKESFGKKAGKPAEGKKAGASPARTVVVIDPGHGGKDPGAVGPSGVREKDITLAIARRARRILESRAPSLKVILTRNDDRYLGLVERTALANTAGAALFVSIHCNASSKPESRGVETYYLDNTTDRAALRLAAKENFVPEEVMIDERDTTNLILADLITASKVADSVPLARIIQRRLVQELESRWRGVEDKGVKKAPFWVLTGATMPCVLVEVSFISNRTEESRLASSSYQEAAAEAIAEGILEYMKRYPELVRAD